MNSLDRWMVNKQTDGCMDNLKDIQMCRLIDGGSDRKTEIQLKGQIDIDEQTKGWIDQHINSK